MLYPGYLPSATKFCIAATLCALLFSCVTLVWGVRAASEAGARSPPRWCPFRRTRPAAECAALLRAATSPSPPPCGASYTACFALPGPRSHTNPQSTPRGATPRRGARGSGAACDLLHPQPPPLVLTRRHAPPSRAPPRALDASRGFIAPVRAHMPPAHPARARARGIAQLRRRWRSRHTLLFPRRAEACSAAPATPSASNRRRARPPRRARRSPGRFQQRAPSLPPRAQRGAVPGRGGGKAASAAPPRSRSGAPRRPPPPAGPGAGARTSAARAALVARRAAVRSAMAGRIRIRRVAPRPCLLLCGTIESRSWQLRVHQRLKTNQKNNHAQNNQWRE